jgi:acyl-CoA dehydrogenase
MFLVSVRSPSVAVHRFQSLDPTRSLHRLQLEATPARLLVSPDEFTGVHRALQARALTLIAAEAVGLQQQLLLLSARYASERHQFGRAIGSFQGVSHPLADVYVNLELSRSLATWAAALHDNGSPESLAAAAAAAAKSLPCAVTAAEVAMQVHGAIGVTWESPLHRYYRRAVSNELLFGPVKELRRLVQDEAVSALVVG